MTTRALYFTGPGVVEVRDEPVPEPGPRQLLVKSIVSAISPGTEMLVYRGLLPEGIALDASIDPLSRASDYPLRYGYSAVGLVVEVDESVDPSWRGRIVFSFQPHGSHFLAQETDLIPLPFGVTPELGTFIPNLETAVNLVMDGRPIIGERVTVFGQGVVGLLTTAVLATFPLDVLVTLDPLPCRRDLSLALGADASLDPTDERTKHLVRDVLRSEFEMGGADLSYELSGNPDALDEAIALTGYSGRVVIGSWYGRKRLSLDLGGRFHRSRQRLISSQVSTIAPELSGRWNKDRRFDVVLSLLSKIDLDRLITHRVPFEQAADAYALIDQHPSEAIQVLLTYEDQ